MPFEYESGMPANLNESHGSRSTAEAPDFATERMGAFPGKTANVERVDWEELFSDPVVDSRLAPPPPNIFATGDPRIMKCDSHKETTNQKDSLESTSKGNSVLHRMYEVSVLAPQGKTEAKDFDSVFGATTASKLEEFGITRVTHSGSAMSVALRQPLQFSDASGSISISKDVAFESEPYGGALTLDRISGVTATQGMFQVAINRIDLEPRQDGYMSGLVYADWTQSPICAEPDGSIHH